MGEGGRLPGDPVHLQVVWVAVAARGVVADDDVGIDLIEDCAHPSGRREGLLVGEAEGMLAVQAGVGVAEGFDAIDAEGIGGGCEFGAAAQCEIAGELGRGEAGLAVGGDDEDDPEALRGCPRHGAGGEECLVVGMRVDEDNRARPGGGAEHRVIVSYRRPVRIAHVTDCYLPRTGGIETQVRALAMQQRSAGDDVRIITATGGRDGVFSGDDVVDGLPVHRVAARLPFDLPIHLRTRREVAQILRTHPVDVVHIHAGVVSPFAWGALRAAHEVGLPVLVTVHSVWGPLARPGFRASRAVVRWDAWGAQLSAVSDVAAAEIARALPGAGEVLVLPNAIDPADWSTYRVEGEPEELRISTVMRLAPRKRIIPFLKIIDQAQRALQGTPRLRVAVIGDGPERARAERFVRDHGLESSVSFLGRLDRAEILEVFANTDLFLQPSVKESFGLAALEARSAGLPIIARSQTGTTQFVHDGVEGLLADSDAGMAQAIMRVARDRALLDRIAAHNESTPPDDTWPRLLALVHEAYLAAQSRSSA